MEPPRTLPERLYLLAYDVRRRKLTAGSTLGVALRAAALAELLLKGRIVEEAGRIHVAGTGSRADVRTGSRADARTASGAAGPEDPLLELLLGQIAASRPRRLRYWIRKDARAYRRTVRDRLEDGGWIRVELRRPWGILSRTGISVRDHRVVGRLAADVTGALRSGRPAARVEPRTAALVALAAAAEVPTVLPRQVRRRHRRRIAELSELSGPTPAALRKVVQQERSAAVG